MTRRAARRGAVVAGLLVALATPASDGAGAGPYDTVRVSVDGRGAQANHPSLHGGSLSGDGRRAVFSGCDVSLTGDPTSTCQVLLWQRGTPGTRVVSRTPSGAPGRGYSTGPVLSPDGQTVAFWSYAPDLVPGDRNGAPDLFVRDLRNGRTERVPLPERHDTVETEDLALSADGRYVVFVQGQVHRYDRRTGTTVLVSADQAGRPGTRANWDPSVSADGRRVAFTTLSRLVPGDTNTDEYCTERSPDDPTGCVSDVYVRDVQRGTTTRVSVDSQERQNRLDSRGPVITADGRTVSFGTSGLDPQYRWGTYLRDLSAGTTVRVRDGQGRPVEGSGRISADGTSIVYSTSRPLRPGEVGGDGDTVTNVWVLDLATAAVRRVSVPVLAGPHPNGSIGAQALSADGRTVLMTGSAANLVRSDTNRMYDLFLRTLPPLG